MSGCNQDDPIVLEGKGFTIHHFIEYIIQAHASPTNLIVCSTRNAFLQELLAEANSTALSHDHRLQKQQHRHGQEQCIPQAIEENNDKEWQSPPSLNLLLPTLDLLARSRSINVSFCPDITHLLAHLSLLPYKTESASPFPSGPNDDGDEGQSRTASSIKRPILAILNPIRLHRPTSSFSAQGFNRTLASAAETANLIGQQLILFESRASKTDGPDAATLLSDDESNDQDMQDYDRLDESLADDMVNRHSPRRSSDKSWDEQLSILNVTTKTFGVGDRGWAGRTVSIRQVAERWCRFTTPN